MVVVPLLVLVTYYVMLFVDGSKNLSNSNFDWQPLTEQTFPLAYHVSKPAINGSSGFPSISTISKCLKKLQPSCNSFLHMRRSIRVVGWWKDVLPDQKTTTTTSTVPPQQEEARRALVQHRHLRKSLPILFFSNKSAILPMPSSFTAADAHLLNLTRLEKQIKILTDLKESCISIVNTTDCRQHNNFLPVIACEPDLAPPLQNSGAALLLPSHNDQRDLHPTTSSEGQTSLHEDEVFVTTRFPTDPPRASSHPSRDSSDPNWPIFLSAMSPDTLPPTLQFEIPSLFMYYLLAHNSSYNVCYSAFGKSNWQNIGKLDLHRGPVLNPPTGEMPSVKVYERKFLSPGWELRTDIAGQYFDSAYNRLSVKSPASPTASPCSGYWDSNAFRSGSPVMTNSSLSVYRFVSDSGQPSSLSDHIFSRGSPRPDPGWNFFELCFYEDTDSANGIHLADITFDIDPSDAGLMVGFIMFSVMGMPLFCGLTLSCYTFKHRKSRRKLRRLRLLQERDQIECRLRNELGIAELEKEDDDDW